MIGEVTQKLISLTLNTSLLYNMMIFFCLYLQRYGRGSLLIPGSGSEPYIDIIGLVSDPQIRTGLECESRSGFVVLLELKMRKKMLQAFFERNVFLSLSNFQVPDHVILLIFSQFGSL